MIWEIGIYMPKRAVSDEVILSHSVRMSQYDMRQERRILSDAIERWVAGGCGEVE